MVEIPGISDIVDAIESGLTAPIDKIKEIIADVENTFSSIGQFIKNIPSKIITGITDIFNQIKSAIISSFSKLEGWFEDLANTIKSPIKSFADTVDSLFKSAFQTIRDKFNDFVKSIENVFSNIRNAITNTISSIGDTLLNVGKSIKDAVTSAVQTVASSVEAGLNDIFEVLQDIPGYLKEGLEYVNWFREKVSYYEGLGLGDTVGAITKVMVEYIIPYLIDIATHLVKGFSKGFGEIEIDMDKLQSEYKDMMLRISQAQTEIAQAFQPSQGGE